MVECPRIASKRTGVAVGSGPEGVPAAFHGYWYGFRHAPDAGCEKNATEKDRQRQRGVYWSGENGSPG